MSLGRNCKLVDDLFRAPKLLSNLKVGQAACVFHKKFAVMSHKARRFATLGPLLPSISPAHFCADCSPA